MNILYLESAIRPCTSCQMCGAVCPTSAIQIVLDEDGFYRPSIDDKICIDCGKCVKVCYKYDQELVITSSDTLQKFHHFAASAKDDIIVANTTSGGIADLLARELVRNGYKVIGVTYDYSSNKAVSKVASDENECLYFRGSKYIQTYSVDAFRELVSCSGNQKFAVFGLPCHIYAISKFLSMMKLRERCLLVDLYCHGCPSMYLWDKTVKSIIQQNRDSSIEKVEFRSKYRGWSTFVLKCNMQNGKEYISTPLKNEFYDLFFCNHLLNESCIDCKLRSTLAYTDIRLGDFWGKDFRRNIRGISGVTLCTERGEKVFNSIIPFIDFWRKDINSFLQFQSWNHKYPVSLELREELLNAIKKEDLSLKDVGKILYRQSSMSLRLKRIIKQVFFHLPICLGKYIRS